VSSNGLVPSSPPNVKYYLYCNLSSDGLLPSWERLEGVSGASCAVLTVLEGVSCRLGCVLGCFGLLPSWGRRLDGIIGVVLGRRRSVWEEYWIFPAAVSVWKRRLGMDSCSQTCVPGPRRFEDTFVFNWALLTAFPFLVWIASIFENVLKTINCRTVGIILACEYCGAQ
jgi:hypothetical protein